MNAWVDAAGWILVHFVWQGALVGAGAAALLRLMTAASPNARYGAACAALATMLAAPLLTAGTLMRADTAAAIFAAAAPAAAVSAPRQDSARASATSAAPLDAAVVPVAPPPDRLEAWLPSIVTVWSLGVLCLLVRLAGGWWRIRGLRRAAIASEPSRWSATCARIGSSVGLQRLVRVVDCAHVDTPMVVGWMKPVVLLPVAALSNLSPGQVEAILAHELAHVRRHDFLVNVLQTIAETLLFYHPAVWWVSARIRDEREHCCDRIAVEVCGDPVSYAEALTELETWRTASTALAVAGTGGSLIHRVRCVLGVRSEDGHRTFSGILTVAVLVLVVFLAAATQYLRAAQPSDRRVAEPGDANDPVAWRMVFYHGTSELNIIGFTARELIRSAYQLPLSRIVGGPGWLDKESFRIVVRLDAPPAADEMPEIVKRTLEERFKLKTHVERRELPAHALVMARPDGIPGPNLRPSTIDCFDLHTWIAAGQPPREPRPNAQRQPICGEESWDSTIAHTRWVAITLPQFAAEMRGIARVSPTNIGLERREVIDRTGLPGRYDIDLHAFLPTAALMARFPVFRFVFEPIGLPSMPTALEEQLGLTLEDATAPYDVIVIDSAERPIQ